jgi:pyruvate dehydrogenase E2 component (dihydrolipoamide acetyltransferase)
MADTIEIRVPNIGDFHEVPVIEVLVKPGDSIGIDDPLLTLESDKATMEVPSPEAGVVASIAVKTGDKVSEGTPILTLARNGAAAAPPPAAAPASPAASAETAAPAPAEPEGESVHASPSIRRFARELGVPLGRIDGTGPHGRITRDDVQAFVKRALDGGVSPAQGAGAGMPFALPAWPKIDFAQFGPIEVRPLPRIKRISGPALHRNWVSIPHVTNHEDADVTDLEAFRKQLNAERPDAKVTILAFLMRAVVAALQLHPELNASLQGDDLVLKRYYHLGFAADTPNGLLVPVVRDVDRKGVLELARETRDLAAKARDGKLSAAEMQGAGFTISSLGGIGGTGFTPIINAPEVAILGVSRAAVRPVWDGSAFQPRLMLPLSLSYDHRVIDGALAARFNATLAGLLADLRRSLL